MKKIWIPQVLAVLMLVWALNPGNPYWYYILLRWVCCSVFVFLVVKAIRRKKEGWGWALGITAVVYNPILPTHLTRDIWSLVNVATIGLALASVPGLYVQMKGNANRD